MAITGEKGAIKIGTVEVARMESWKLSIKANEVDVTSFDSDGWEETAITTKGFEVSMDGIFDKSDTTGQKAIMTAMSTGVDVALELFILKTATDADFEGKVKITGLDIDTSVKDKVKLSLKCKGNGALTGL
jgi:predicted secreted protein